MKSQESELKYATFANTSNPNKKKMIATITFTSSPSNYNFVSYKVTDQGGLKNMGKRICHFLHDNTDDISKTAVRFASLLDNAEISTPPVKTSSSEIEYIIKNVDKSWFVTLRAARTTQDIPLTDFYTKCAFDPTKKMRLPSLHQKDNKLKKKVNKSGYSEFGKHVRETMKSSINKESSTKQAPKEVMRKIGEMWKNLTAEDKSKWVEKAKEASEIQNIENNEEVEAK